MRRILLVLLVLFVGCHLERRPTGPDFDLRQVFVVPDTISIDPLGQVQFQAYGRTASGDSVGVLAQWAASTGSISSDATYTADTADGDATIIAQVGGGADAVPLVATATVHKRRIVALLLSPSSVSLQPGAVMQFSTRAVRAAGDTVYINPSYSATGGTITSGGVYTAGLGAGTYRVIASRPSGVFDTASVTIAQAPVASVSVNPSAMNVPVGGVTQLTATARDAAGNVLTGRAVAWSSNSPGVATVSATGVVSGVAAGSATITATSEGQSGSAAVTVVMAPVASVQVSPGTANLLVGTNALFIATTRDAAGNVLSGRTITWSSDAPGIVSVSTDGLVSAVASGSATITATSEGKSGAASVTVSVVPVASVSVTPPTAGLLVGGSVQLSATTKDSANNVLNGRPVTWSSSAPGVATVSASGLVTAVAAGSATITATSEGKSGTSSITVTVVPVATVTVAPSTKALRVGFTAQLTATTKDSAGTVLTGRVVTWSSSAPGVATVSASGLVTAVAAGSATITATSEGKSGTSAITVTVAPVATVTVSPATSSLNIGATLQLSVVTKDSAGNVLTGRTVTWSSNSPAVATVSTTGQVTAVATGSASITATSEGKSGTATITVALVPVATVAVAPATKALRVASTAQLTATTKDAAGNVLTGRAVTWSSGAPGVATVSASGVVTAVGVGTATITATSEGKSGTSVITVTLAPVATVTVSPASGSVNVGSTIQLSVVTKDSAGNVLTGRVITWSSSATGTATVSASGLVLGVAAGTVTITATSEGKSASATITVTTATTVHTGKFVSPTGSSGGDGSMARPWDLSTALSGAGGRVVAGDTIWLRGGTYNGSFHSSLNGTAAKPIVVRQYPGERATLDGASSSTITLIVDGSWTVYWGFEIMNSILTRFGSGLAARPSGVYVESASNVKLVNLIIHDTGHGTYIENTAHNIEIYGWIVYNGGNDNSSRSDGHGIYVRNDGTTQKVIAENVIFNQFGFGIHSYAEGGDLLKRMTFEGNVMFNNSSLSAFDGPNMILGGETSADQDTVRNNMYYFSPGYGARNLRVGYTTQLNASGVVEGNYIVGGNTEAVDVTLWQNLLFRNNTLVETGRVLAFADPNTAAYGWSGNTHYRSATANAWGFSGTDYTFSSWQQQTGLGATDQVAGVTPTAPKIFVRPNKYEPGRANIIVYNWGRQSAVSVDLSNVLAVGQRYEIRNVQDIFGTPVVSGLYSGGSVTLPMGGVAPPQPIGGSPSAPIRTGPDFDVFVVVPIS